MYHLTLEVSFETLKDSFLMYLWVGDLKTDLKTDFIAEKRGKKIPVFLTCFHHSPFTDFFFPTPEHQKAMSVIPHVSHN